MQFLNFCETTSPIFLYLFMDRSWVLALLFIKARLPKTHYRVVGQWGQSVDRFGQFQTCGSLENSLRLRNKNGPFDQIGINCDWIWNAFGVGYIIFNFMRFFLMCNITTCSWHVFTNSKSTNFFREFFLFSYSLSRILLFR